MRRIIQKLAATVFSSVSVMVLFLAPATEAMAARFWKNSVISGSWSNGNNWSASSGAGVDSAGVPVASDTVNIRPTDGFNHTVTYDYTGAALTLAQLNVDLTGAVATTTTFSISANNLTASNEYIGYNGRGVFDHSGGTNTIAAGAGFLDVGVFAGSTGTYNLSGTAALVANTPEYIGDVGTGFFNQTGGTHNINGTNNLYLGYNPVGNTGTYTLSAGTLSSTGAQHVGYNVAGTFNQSGGTNTATGGLYLGSNALGSNGTYALSGTGALTSNGDEYIGKSGSGYFTQSGGTNTVSNDLNLGDASSGHGEYSLSGGLLTVGSSEHIGFGNSSFTQTGGTHTVGASLFLAVFLDQAATFSLSNGSLAVNGAEILGNLGPATFTQSGGTHTVNSGIRMGATSGGTGTYILSGGMFAVTFGDAFIGGAAAGAGGTGVFNISGGTATISGLLKVYNTPGTLVTLDSATLSAGSLDTDGNASHFNWISGALNLTNSGVTIGSAGPLGTSLTIDSAKVLTVSGTTTIDPFRALTLSGGSFSTGDLLNNGTFNFTSGTLGITGAGGLTVGTGGALGDTVNLGLNQILNVTNLTTVASTGTLVGGEGRVNAIGGITNNGEVLLSGSAPRITGGTITNNKLIRGDGRIDNPVTNASAGEIRAENGKTLLLTGASGANAGKVNLQGGTAEFSQPLTNGSAGQILGRGTLITGGTGLNNNGNVSLSSGTSDVFGKVNNATGTSSKGISIAGNADVTFWNDVTNTSGLFKVNSGSAATFFGDFSGNGITGNAADIHFEGGVSPGFSPASVTFGGNVSLGGAATLLIELGGTTPGALYDQVHVSGQLSLDGTLNVSLINGFSPASGNSFDILDWGTLSGTFSALVLQPLAGGLAWNTSQLYTNGVLSVASAGVPGDYNNNGAVDAADYVLWRNGGPLANEVDAPGTVNAADYTASRARFGHPTSGSGSGSGSAGASPSQTGVPEPSTLVLLLFGVAGFYLRRRRAA